MEIESLKQKVEEYKQRSQIAKLKVGNVKKSVEEQKEILLKGFNRGIDEFAKGTKSEIHYQIEQIANSKSKSVKAEYLKGVIVNTPPKKQSDNSHDIGSTLANLGGDILDLFSKNVGNIFRVGFRLGTTLVQAITESIPDIFDGSTSDVNETNINDNLYILRLRTKEDAEKFQKTINDVCSPNIQRFWIETQDNLIRHGNYIRLQLTEKIQSEIQDISNELSKYLGDALKVDLNVNDIQFPSFEFSGIDAKIKQQQAVIQRTTKEPRKNCCNQVYYADNKYEYKQDFYEVDLLHIKHSIQLRIDEQVSRNREILDRVIEKQVEEDFRSAEQQINNYIQRFQDEFDRLLKERETKELTGDQIRENLNLQKDKLNEYLNELKNIRVSLNTWKPV